MIPSNEQLIGLATALARRKARNEADIDDLVQQALWDVHYSCKGEDMPQALGLAQTIILRAIRKYYNGEWTRAGGKYDPTECVSLESSGFTRAVDPWAEVHDEMDMELYFQQLEAVHGPLARKVAENLIQPTDEEYCRYLIKHQRVRERRRARGEHVRNFKKVTTNRHQLRRALGLNNFRWEILINNIKDFTREWLGLPEPEPKRTAVQRKKVHHVPA